MHFGEQGEGSIRVPAVDSILDHLPKKGDVTGIGFGAEQRDQHFLSMLVGLAIEAEGGIGAE